MQAEREALQNETVVWKYIKIATIVRYCVTYSYYSLFVYNHHQVQNYVSRTS